MEFRILGPLEVRKGGALVPLSGGKPRALIGVLLLHANEVVSSERLVDELWGERPPESAAKLVQGYVSGIRRALGGELLATQSPGYRLDLREPELDLTTFQRLLAQASAAPAERAAVLRREALALWRGPALSDLELHGPARHEAERLNELRITAQIERIEADVELGRHDEVVGDLEALVAGHPLRERLRGLLMLTLYRSGRQAEALEVYQQTRVTLVDELGLEPGEDLQTLQRRILAHDPALAPPRVEPAGGGAARATPPVQERPDRTRKTITVVFCDLSDSAALAEKLDPERLHGVLSRYYDASAAVFERHGGELEKFIGDAVVAVYGVPVVREDDALRAVRGAIELRDAVSSLNDELERELGVRLSVHVGINTGEVFAGPPSQGRPLATGDAVTVAARLQQAASKGEILIGEDTYGLVAEAIVAELVEPLQLKGRSQAVRAWRLIGLAGEISTFTRAPLAPFVGRERELAELRATLLRAAEERDCRLCTIVGPPGIGKSRIGLELIESVREASQIAVGRCLPYGEGITYWPLADMIRQLTGSEPAERIRQILAGDERAALIAERVLGAVGYAETVSPKEETFWAVRKLFEALARDRPLTAVIDDVHWAEPTLLELLEYLVAFTRDTPVLLLCLGRSEFLESRPGWAAPRANTSLISMTPLSLEESRKLVGRLPRGRTLSERSTARVIEAAAGNPLFIEQLIALSADDASDVTAVPPSIQALLAARIDRLEPEERTVLARAAVEGRTFHPAGLIELLPEAIRDRLDTHLLALVRKELIRPDRPDVVSEEAFRFRHILIRDAAYASVPKQTRAELHERFARWLDNATAERPAEYAGIAGYHLEQAFRYRRELGPIDEHGRSLAARAGERLTAAGRRALAGGDPSAAVNLLGRAQTLLSREAEGREELLSDLGGALVLAGEFAEAERVLSEAIEASARSGNRRIEVHAVLERSFLRALTDPAGSMDELRRVAEGALGELEALGDEPGLAKAWRRIADANWMTGHWNEQERALERSLVHAERAGDAREAAVALMRLPMAIYYGPTPVDEAITRAEAILERAGNARVVAANALVCLGGLHAMTGRFDQARTLLVQGGTALEELGFRVWLAGMSLLWSDVEMLAGDPAAAERALRRSYEALEGMGERGVLSRVAAELTRAVYAQGRYAEARRLAAAGGELSGAGDVASQISWLTVRAKIHARNGELVLAETLAQDAVRLAETTDDLDNQGDVLMDLAEVLELTGRAGEAVPARARAVELFARKGNIVSRSKAESLLDGHE